MTEPTVTLKPCPFCGGEAKLHSYLLEAAVVCVQCGAEMSADHGAKLDDKTGNQLAARAWNTRTASAPAGEVEPVAMQRTIDRLHRELSDLRTKYVDALAAHPPAPADLVEAANAALHELDAIIPLVFHDTTRGEMQAVANRLRAALAKHGGA